MKLRKIISLALVYTLIIGCFSTTTRAAEVPSDQNLLNLEHEQLHILSSNIAPYALGSIDVTVSANSIAFASNQISMGAGETVTINCAYNPAYASVDFGLVDSDSVFHYINVTGGSINESIIIPERGTYTLGIRNKSSVSVSVVGFLNY